MGEYSVYCTGKITLPFRPTIAITSLAGYLFLLYYRNQPLQPQSIFLAACQCLPLMVQNGGCRRFTGTEAQKTEQSLNYERTVRIGSLRFIRGILYLRRHFRRTRPCKIIYLGSQIQGNGIYWPYESQKKAKAKGVPYEETQA